MADAPAPVLEIPAAPIVDAAPVVAPVVVETTAPAGPALQHPAEVPTFLEGLTTARPKEETPSLAAPVPDKPATEAKVEPPGPADKPADAKTAEPVVEAPVEYKFNFAEHVTPQAEKVAAFTEFAREHKLSPEAAQKAIDHFNDAAQAFVAEQKRQQIQTFNDTRAGWRKQAMADPEIGGAGHNAAIGAIARMRDLSVSDHAPGSDGFNRDLAEFNEFLRVTGAGDHPAYLKQLHRFARWLDEPRAPAPNPKPVPNSGRPPSNSLYKQTSARQ